MKYDKDRIKRIIEYKDSLLDTRTQKDIEWLIGCYNDYFINSKEYEEHRKKYNTILNKYYNVEDEKANLKEIIITLKNKYSTLNRLYKDSCKNKKSML